MGMSSFVAAVVAGERTTSGSSEVSVGKARPGIATSLLQTLYGRAWSGSAWACDWLADM